MRLHDPEPWMALAYPELTSHENTRIGVIFDGKLIFRCFRAYRAIWRG